MKDAIMIVTGLCVWALTIWIGYTEGRASIMEHTVVRAEAPYYSGVFFGTCKYIGPLQACATHVDDNPPENKP
jgi:hypothetical protein